MKNRLFALLEKIPEEKKERILEKIVQIFYPPIDYFTFLKRLSGTSDVEYCDNERVGDDEIRIASIVAMLTLPEDQQEKILSLLHTLAPKISNDRYAEVVEALLNLSEEDREMSVTKTLASLQTPIDGARMATLLQEI